MDKPLNLKLEAGTPYQVVEVDYKVRRSLKQPSRSSFTNLGPGYSPARRPYGWDYERGYEPTEFKSRYVDWRKSYVAAGRPAFCGLVGHGGAVRVDTIYGSRYEGYAASREIAGHRADLGGYTHSPMGPETPGPTRNGYPHSASPGSAPLAAAPGPISNGYSHSPSRGASGYTHSESSPANTQDPPSIGGYTHSAPSGAKASGGRSPRGARGYSGSHKRGEL